MTLIFCLIFILNISVSLNFKASIMNKQKSPPVLKIYGESLCPDTLKFISNEIKSIYNNKSKSNLISNIDIIMFGNAQENSDSNKNNRKYTCQHGDKECKGNKMWTCAKQYLEQNNFIMYSICLSDILLTKLKVDIDFVKESTNCISDNSKLKSILNCYNNNEGDEIVHEEALKTKQHDGVPYIFLDDIHNDEIQKGITADAVSYLCIISNNINKLEGCK